MIKSKLKNRNLSQEDVFNFSELFKLMKPRVMSLVIFTCAVGIGLKQVLVINASKSDSYHMFKAPAAPEPIATASNEIKEVLKSTL